MKYTKEDFSNQMELIDKDTDKERYVYKDTDNELSEILFDIQMDIMPDQFELSYQVMNDAIYYIEEHYEEDTDETIQGVYQEEFASVYNQTRLSYLNYKNEDDIAEYLPNGAETISQACAMYYDNQVAQMVKAIINKLTE